MRVRTLRLGALAAALAIAAASSASAATIDLGTILQGTYTPLAGSLGTGAVSEQDYIFTLSQASEIQIILTAVGPPSLTVPTGGSYPVNGIELLYNGNPVAGTSSFSAQNEPTVNPILGIYIWNSASLDVQGDYTLKVFLAGNNTDSSIPLSGGLNASAVPEASTWSMMAFGFAALLFAGYRSRRPDISIVGA